MPIRAARSKRDRMLLQVAYAAGLRISEIVGLSWPDVIARDKGRAQLSIEGKGGKLRQVLLPAEVGGALMTLSPPDTTGPVFCGRSGKRLGERAVFGMLKRTAKRAGLPAAVSRTGCAMRMVRMRSTEARRFPRSRRRWGMKHCYHERVTCTPGRTVRAASA